MNMRSAGVAPRREPVVEAGGRSGQPQRNFHVVGQMLDSSALTGLRSLACWPAQTRYAVCSVDHEGVLRAYVEMTRPVRPRVFGFGLRPSYAGAAERERHRRDVLARSDNSWEVGSWEAGQTGKNKTPRRALSRELRANQQALITSQQQCIAMLLEAEQRRA